MGIVFVHERNISKKRAATGQIGLFKNTKNIFLKRLKNNRMKWVRQTMNKQIKKTRTKWVRQTMNKQIKNNRTKWVTQTMNKQIKRKPNAPISIKIPFAAC